MHPALSCYQCSYSQFLNYNFATIFRCLLRLRTLRATGELAGTSQSLCCWKSACYHLSEGFDSGPDAGCRSQVVLIVLPLYVRLSQSNPVSSSFHRCLPLPHRCRLLQPMHAEFSSINFIFILIVASF